jgi:hypothetical protein
VAEVEDIAVPRGDSENAAPANRKLAVDLRRGRDMPLNESVDAALTHIECEDYVRVEMSLGGSYTEGIEKFRLSRQAHANHLEQLAGMPTGVAA